MINKNFFIRDSLIVAKELLGKVINFYGKKAMIVETEAYRVNDPGSHAFRGLTKRNKVMFDEGGKLYVYLCYGVHKMLNIVTDKKGIPSAVLIRAVEPLNFNDKTNGPGLVTKSLGVSLKHNAHSVTSSDIHLEHYKTPKEIITTTRIGLRAGNELPYRFYIKDNKFISKK